MASKITEQQVEHVAELAKLEFPEDELGKFTTQLGNIIDMFEDLEAVDTDGVEPMTSATDRVNVMREDKAIKSSKEEQEALLNNAPETDGGYIKFQQFLTKVRTANNGFLPNKLESIAR